MMPGYGVKAELRRCEGDLGDLIGMSVTLACDDESDDEKSSLRFTLPLIASSA